MLQSAHPKRQITAIWRNTIARFHATIVAIKIITFRSAIKKKVIQKTNTGLQTSATKTEAGKKGAISYKKI